MGGGITNLKRNAFTLIELLAIIVILAIIAVITVPIILNIIENSRKGAATDSAYGYKDSVNKYYVSELSNNKKLMLNGTYEVKANGVLNGNFGVTENAEDRIIPIDGEKPSSGKLHYTNTILDGGCLVIGDYKITFKSDGSVNETVKGDCSTYEYSEENGGEEQSSIPTIPTCPGCVFANNTEEIELNSPLSDYVNDYRLLKSNNEQRTSFLGYVLDDGVIVQNYACGINNGNAFCLKSGDDSETAELNINTLLEIYPNCGANLETSQSSCGDESSTVHAQYVYDGGTVRVAFCRATTSFSSCDY